MFKCPVKNVTFEDGDFVLQWEVLVCGNIIFGHKETSVSSLLSVD
jgi:hypothetical protein